MKINVIQIFSLKRILSLEKILLVGIFFIFQLNASAQQKTISGTVTDTDKLPLTGVTVQLKGTSRGTLTDINGKFSLTVPETGSILVISFIGMETKEVTVDNRSAYNVTLSQNTVGLEEVVVIGYGTQKKINLTGAVSRVDSKFLESRPITSVGQGLQGIVSNLNITQDNGSLGKASSFNIRGYTSINGGSPLILVNGIPMDINLINPNDIENISVLKDAASAAIYGARAAYGVILITTKRGGKGVKPTVSLSTYYSVNKPTVTVVQMNSMERMLYMNEGSMRTTGLPFFDEYFQAAITAHYNDPSQPEVFFHPGDSPTVWSFCANTDWGKELLKDYYPMQQHTATLSGGSDNFDYYTSFSYFKQEGMTRHFDEKYNRYNFMSNLNYDITKWLTVGTKISINISDKKYPPNDEAGRFPEDYVPFSTYQWPDYPVYLPDGHYAQGSVPNMVQMHEEGGYQSRNINDTWLTGIIKLTPIKNMTFNLDYSFNVKGTEELNYFTHMPRYNRLGNFDGYQTWTDPTSVTKSSYNNKYYIFNAYADYEKTFNKKHYFKVMVGFNQENASNIFFQAIRNQLILDDVPFMSLAVGEQHAYDSATEYAIRGAFARFNYSFADRYLVELNSRYDGSSKFPKKDRFAFFPSLSLGWRINNEAFFNSLKNAINILKLRGSFGNLGNQNVAGNYPYIATLSSGQIDYLIDGVKPMTVYAPGLISPSLTWETVTQIDFGVDFAVLDNKLSGSFDIYRRDTKNMLTKSETLPAVLAVIEPNSNAADLKTTGFDFTLDWKHSIQNLKYGITILLSNNTSEITKYSNPSGILSDYYVGQKIGEIWGLVTGGFFQTDEEAAALDQTAINGRKRQAGDIWFVDIDGDGKITRGKQTLDDHGDMKIIGNSTPRYSFGFRPNVTWKGFDLDIFLQGVMKRDSKLDNFYFLGHYTGSTAVQPQIATDYWSPENPDAYFPRPLISGGSDVTATQTHFLQNAAYMRLKQLTFGYVIPRDLTRKMRIERIRVYFSGNNLWEMTKMIKISDPEQNGVRLYPLQRSISVGANIDF